MPNQTSGVSSTFMDDPMTTTPQAVLLRESAQNALTTLDGIANANPRDKADFETPNEWIAWAKSRARFAADALRAPVAQEIYAERILKQMLQAEKKCGTCGFIGQEDPIKGCPKCGFDDMQAKLQATQADHVPEAGKMVGRQDVAAIIRAQIDQEALRDQDSFYRGMERAAELVEATQAEPTALKGHEIAQIVNQLRDVAKEFHGTQQLRERIVHIIVPVLRQYGQPAQAEPVQAGELPDERLKTGSAKELQALFKSTKVDKYKSRISKRLAIRDAQIRVLSACLDDVKRKARETPAWSCAYNSAITSIELKISEIKSNY